MPKKQVTNTSTAAAAAPARAAKPGTSRVSTVKHSKSPVAATSATEMAESITPAEVVSAPEAISPQEAIAKIAYGYWIARGYQGGNPHEDWVRAEQEFLSKA